MTDPDDNPDDKSRWQMTNPGDRRHLQQYMCPSQCYVPELLCFRHLAGCCLFYPWTEAAFLYWSITTYNHIMLTWWTCCLPNILIPSYLSTSPPSLPPSPIPPQPLFLPLHCVGQHDKLCPVVDIINPRLVLGNAPHRSFIFFPLFFSPFFCEMPTKQF